MPWFFDVVKDGRSTPDHVGLYDTQELCQTAKDAWVADSDNASDVSVGEPFEHSGDFPVQQYEISLGDGSTEFVWTDGSRGQL